MFSQKRDQSADRAEEKQHAPARRAPQPGRQRARNGRDRPRPHAPAERGKEQHIQPRRALHGRHAAPEKAVEHQRAEKDIRRHGGRARPVAQSAEKIVQKAEQRAEQKKRGGLTRLNEQRQLHYLKSRAKKPVDGPDSS